MMGFGGFVLVVFAVANYAFGVVGQHVVNLPERTSKFPDLYEASVLELQVGLERGHFSSVDLVNVSFQSMTLGYLVIVILPVIGLLRSNRRSQPQRTRTPCSY